MQTREFYGECFRRAFRGRLLLAEGIAGVLGLIAVPVGAQLPDILGQSSWLPFYLFVTVFILVVFYGLIKAPRDMHLEALAEIGALKLTIEDKEKIQKALTRLWQLRQDGVDLRNEVITSKTYKDWHKRYTDWWDEVGEQAGLISENLKQWLVTLDQVTQPPIVDFISPKHKHNLRNFNEVLHRLQRFLEKDLAWPKIGD